MTDYNYKDRSVLITGASGFIGSHLTRRLLKEGALVNVLLMPGDPHLRLCDIKEKIKIFPVDIRDGERLFKVVKEVKPGKIFHLAGFTSADRSPSALEQSISANWGGTLNVLRALSDVECEALVCTCTAEAYGKNHPPFREDMALDPLSPYSFSKAAATLACRTWANLFGIRVTVLRLFLVYGPDQEEGRFLPQLIKSGLSGEPMRMTKGEQTREFTYVDDVVESFLLAAERGGGCGEIYNICTGEEISLRELIVKVEEIIGRKIILDPQKLPYRKNEIWRYVGDYTKANKDLGWRPSIPLEVGLTRTIKWYQNKMAFKG